MNELPELLEFLKLLHKYRQIIRRIYATSEDRLENDVEHSYELAMTAWYVITTNKLSLDVGLTLQYALIHDLPEVYAGDTPAFHSDELRKTKEEREHDALKKLVEDHPEAKEIFDLVLKYEKREDEESKFIYSLDKLLPMLDIHIDGGRTWKMNKVTLPMSVEYKESKIAISPPVFKYYKDLIEILKDKQHLFHEEK